MNSSEMDEARDDLQVREAMSGDEEGDSMNSCGNHSGLLCTQLHV